MPNDFARRDFLKLSAAGVFAPTLSGWLPVMAKELLPDARRTRDAMLAALAATW